MRRVFYWAGPIIVLWRLVILSADRWLQQSWQAHLSTRGAMEGFWALIAAFYFAVLALGSGMTRFAFFYKHDQPRASFKRLLPHLCLCSILFAVSLVLEDPGVAVGLSTLNLQFLRHMLFYTALLWYAGALMKNLSPRGTGSS